MANRDCLFIEVFHYSTSIPSIVISLLWYLFLPIFIDIPLHSVLTCCPTISPSDNPLILLSDILWWLILSVLMASIYYVSVEILPCWYLYSTVTWPRYSVLLLSLVVWYIVIVIVDILLLVYWPPAAFSDDMMMLPEVTFVSLR